MKKLNLKPFGPKLAPAAIGLVFSLLSYNATADNWFDVNGATAGYGTVASGSYSWDDPNWATVVGGGNATGNWVANSFARFLGTGSYSVTVNNPESMAGLFQAVAVNSALTLTINAAGSGSLSIFPSVTLTTGLPAQGFFCNGGNTVIINAPITGTGGINFGVISGTGNIFLNGINTYSGGTALSTSSYNINFNNNNAFGTGPININNTTFANLLSAGGSTITLPNNWTNATATSGLNFGSAANTPVICLGSWSLLTFGLNLRNNGNSTAPLTLSGPISGSGGTLNLSGNSGGKITLSGANTYTGKTTITGGSNLPGVGITLSVNSFNSVSAPVANSSLGRPTTAGNGTIGIGVTTFASTLIYTGSGETSDRIIDLTGSTAGATLQADGSGPLVLTAVNSASVAGAKTLTLQGAYTGPNSIGKIVNSSSGATSVTKEQAGTWVLTGANTYTGVTTVNAGILKISGSIVGDVNVNNNGTLQLDSPSTLSPAATLNIANSATNILNFSGAQPVTSLVIGGVTEPVNTTWGPIGSGAQNENAVFTGSGTVIVSGSPAIVQQPQPITCYPDAVNKSFSVTVVGASPFTNQWKFNGATIPGATDLTYTIPLVESANAGTYSCWVSNFYGYTNSVNATLTVLPTNSYVSAILQDSPISYWRLDETNGNVANDWVGGNNGVYNNATLNQSGYSLTDTNPSVGIFGTNTTTGRGYVQVATGSPFPFAFLPGTPSFTFEAWAYFTNLTTKARLFSTLNLTAPNGYAFGVLAGGTKLEFTTGTVLDNDSLLLASPLVAGQWYHLVCTCDGGIYVFYVNGQQVGSVPVVFDNGHGGVYTGARSPLLLGANPPAYTFGGGDNGAEQLNGRIDEAAVYNTALSDTQVANHYAARYADSPLVPALPNVSPPTNYVSLATTLTENAAGVGLSYQWFKVPSTSVGSGSAITLSPLQLSDAGNYYVQITDASSHVTNSPTNYVAVLPIPTSASDLNLTNGLVLHLPFDSDYKDISGRNNHGTNVGATALNSGGAVGSKALHYSSDTGSSTFNYVTLGVRPDLKFGASTDFTVAYWVRQPADSTYTNLPFFGDAIGSTDGILALNGGIAFAPYATPTSAGGWMLGMGSTAHEMTSPGPTTSFPDSNLINDNNWHHLVHVASRVSSVVTYLDGKQVDSEAISFLGDLTTANPTTIGQDPSGTYPVTADADLDDVGVWRRTLTSLEVSGMFLAGATNGVSFAPAVITLSPVTITGISGTSVGYTGGGGSQFVLLSSANVAAPANTWTRSATNTVTPGSFTIPPLTNAQTFYRVKSE